MSDDDRREERIDIGDKLHIDEYAMYSVTFKSVALDGNYSIKELKLIIQYMEEHP